MNVVITLTRDLIDAILDGRKIYEMRKVFPKHMHLCEDGFFCVEKGTKDVICWCRVDYYRELSDRDEACYVYGKSLAVSDEWIESYMNGKSVKLWYIGAVHKFDKPLSLERDLLIDRAPQSFAYTPLSSGRSY